MTQFAELENVESACAESGRFIAAARRLVYLADEGFDSFPTEAIELCATLRMAAGGLEVAHQLLGLDTKWADCGRCPGTPCEVGPATNCCQNHPLVKLMSLSPYIMTANLGHGLEDVMPLVEDCIDVAEVIQRTCIARRNELLSERADRHTWGVAEEPAGKSVRRADGPLRVGSRNLFAWRGETAMVPPKAWALADHVWREAGHSAEAESAVEAVWGHDANATDNAISKAVQAFNNALLEASLESPPTMKYSAKQGRVLFDVPAPVAVSKVQSDGRRKTA